MFQTTKCSSSGSLIYAVLWHQTHTASDHTTYTDARKNTIKLNV